MSCQGTRLCARIVPIRPGASEVLQVSTAEKLTPDIVYLGARDVTVGAARRIKFTDDLDGWCLCEIVRLERATDHTGRRAWN